MSAGTVCVVLHTHLPWLAHAGEWPVGEEWLYQSWSASYLPVVALLERLADEGHRDVVTLGVTPVLAAQLDDPHCLSAFHTWLGGWQIRAQGLTGAREEHLRDTAAREWQAASEALSTFERGWRYGGSPRLRALADRGVAELLGGPATHPVLPLLRPRVAAAQLTAGLDDAAIRLGSRPEGIWLPECAWVPELAEPLSAAGVRRLVLDGPTLAAAHRSTADAWTLGASDLVGFGRDLATTYRVWSPTAGYPGGADYRDFHTWHHDSGLRPARVTGRGVAPADKAPYDPVRASVALAADVEDFVSAVRARCDEVRMERDGRPGLVVLAWDTELFGHWWHEGPAFLEAVLRRLPAAGIRLTTLRGAVESGAVEGRADLPAGSWGLGKDLGVWTGEPVRDLLATALAAQDRLLQMADSGGAAGRHSAFGQLLREVFLATASDWAFMVSHDSAADYARGRAGGHASRFHRLADLVERGDLEAAASYTEHLRLMDGSVPAGAAARLLGRRSA